MSEQLITIIFFAICFGQVWALTRSRLTAVIYYICAATLPYFSFWMFVSWDPARVCGSILVLGGWALYRRPEGVPQAGSYRLWIFFGYMVFLTLAGAMFWPVEAMSGRSAAYGSLRPYVQIFNWSIMVGVAWQIAQALSTRGAFKIARRWLIVLGMLHCTVAIYQVVAFETDLPITGIRRVAVDVGLNADDPHLAMTTIGELPLYRATSFAGEPRGLASASMLWITALFTLYVQGRANRRTHMALLLSLLVLVLTLSTSGWGGFFCCLALMLYFASSHRKSRWLGAFVVLLLFLGILMAVDSTGLLPEQISLSSIFENRWTERVDDPLTDMPVKETLKVLSAYPQFVLFGTGAGGMSFYIAENLGGREVILAATVGWVCILGDLGLAGILLMITAMWGGIRNLLFRWAASDDVSRYMAFMGCVFLCQYMISAGSWMLSCAFGFLLASQFRSEAMARGKINISEALQASAGEEQRASSC